MASLAEEGLRPNRPTSGDSFTSWGASSASQGLGMVGLGGGSGGVKRRRGTFAVDPDANPITNEDVYRALEDFPRLR